jgi:hypothetical protein
MTLLLLLIIPAWLLLLSLVVGICWVARAGDADMGSRQTGAERPVADAANRRPTHVGRTGNTAHRPAPAEIAA